MAMHPTNLAFTLLHWVVSALALLITAYVVPGFRIKGFGSAMIAAVVIGLVNALIGPLLFFLALPLTILTFGFFTFVVDAAILKICAYLMRDFAIDSWFSAIIGAIILAVVSYFLHYYIV